MREKLDPIADRGQPKRIAPSKLREKLDAIAKNARRLLKSLGVNDPDEAPDGPGNREILAALVLVGERNEDPVIEATQRIGRLTEFIDGIAAAAELEGRAKKAAIAVAEIGKLTVRDGNLGDDAVNGWIAAMMDLYRRITGRKPAIAIGLLFVRMLGDRFKSTRQLEVEILVLRHQLNVLQQRAHGRRPHLRWLERALFTVYRRCPRILDAITIVRPETVVRWHRKGFAAYWRWKSRSQGGRPRIAQGRSATRPPSFWCRWSISPCRLLPHPAWAFPEQQTGRRPRVPFRGLLRLHSRYGPLDCSAARWRPLSRGFGPVGYPTKSLVSYQINRQFSGWNSLHWC